MRQLVFSVTIMAIIAVMAITADSRALFEDYSYEHDIRGEEDPAVTTALASSFARPYVDYGLFETGQVNTIFSNTGQFGVGYLDLWPESVPSFETPPGSNIRYLFGGAIWVGGIVGGDTLVSVGADGWQYVREMWPEADVSKAAVCQFESAPDYALRAEFYDTLTDPTYIDYYPYVGRPHLPMNIQVANRGYIWTGEPLNNIILYDVVITNIGDRLINEGYVGFYFDGDVYYIVGGSGNRDFDDDLTGSFREHSLAYIIDNDGNPDMDGHFNPDTSATRLLAFKFLKSSAVAADTNFNWWISNMDPALDFGPRKKGTPDDPFRDFGGFLGTPEGDANKYYIMRHKEWDYDQIYSHSIQNYDTTWLEPGPLSPMVSDGYDTRFLMSLGPFTLPPDSSVRFLYALLTGDSVHIYPLNLENNFDPDNPMVYYDNLDFTHIIAIASWCDLLVGSILDPMMPPVGLHVAYKDDDSVVVQWDRYVFDGVTGYNLYLYEIPDDSLPYSGVLPPWISPGCPNLAAKLGDACYYTFDTLHVNRYYAVSARHRTRHNSGAPCHLGEQCPFVFFKLNKRSPAPTPVHEYVFNHDGVTATIEWEEPPGVDVDHYNIYRFVNSDSAKAAYHAFYDGERSDDIEPADSFFIEGEWFYYYAMEPLGQIDSGIVRFTDSNSADESVYIISAIDKDGFESEFSNYVTFHQSVPKSRDVLVLLPKSLANADCIKRDTLRLFYETLLAGYDFDIYDMRDSTRLPYCSTSMIDVWYLCIDWHDFMPFRLIILPEGLRDTPETIEYNDHMNGLTRYLQSGGNMCLFGSAGEMDYDYPPQYSAVESEFLRRYFGADFILHAEPFVSYEDGDLILTDSLLGFSYAMSVEYDFPDIHYNPIYPIDSNCRNIWAGFPWSTAVTFQANKDAKAIYEYKSRYPSISAVEDDPVGIRNEHDLGSTTYWFGFHLWFMDIGEARQLIDRILADTPLDADDDEASGILPEEFSLHQNYPNPFNPETRITFNLPVRSEVTIEVYNILGQRVATIFDEMCGAGTHTAIWDGTDHSGSRVATGIYFYRLEAGEFSETRKMLLLK